MLKHIRRDDSDVVSYHKGSAPAGQLGRFTWNSATQVVLKVHAGCNTASKHNQSDCSASGFVQKHLAALPSAKVCMASTQLLHTYPALAGMQSFYLHYCHINIDTMLLSCSHNTLTQCLER